MRELIETVSTLAGSDHHGITFERFALDDRVVVEETGSIGTMER